MNFHHLGLGRVAGFALAAIIFLPETHGAETAQKKIVVTNILNAEAVPGEFVMKLAQGVAGAPRAALESVGLKIAERINLHEALYRLRAENPQKTFALLTASPAGAPAFREDSFRQTLLRFVSQMPGVEYVEPNFVYHALEVPEVLPNDPQFSALWAMKNTGQGDSEGTVGKPGADIKATEAWALSEGSRDVKVAIIDTGIDMHHPELVENLWSMPGIPAVHGFNAITGLTDPSDDNNHGTHCAGIMGAAGDNAIGVVGVNWQLSIMAVKFLAASGSGNLADGVKAIDWALANGAKILSNSWGGGAFSQALLDAIKRADAQGALFVVAAGNDGMNLDTAPSYPAAYDSPNVVSVAASTNLDTLASFSNYGGKSVHLAAPGNNILSTVIGGNFDTLSGTSMAAPHVSGAAALLWAKEPSLSVPEIKARLLASTDKIKTFRHKIISGGRLNVYNLLANIAPPGFVSIPDSAWEAPIVTEVQTVHPYPNGQPGHWTLEVPGAQFIRVHFKRFQTEAGYDTLKLTSAATGETVDTLSGKLGENVWSNEIDGAKVILDFKSDGSINDFGFEIDAYEGTSFIGS